MRRITKANVPSFNLENFFQRFQNSDILHGVADYQSPMIRISLRPLVVIIPIATIVAYYTL